MNYNVLITGINGAIGTELKNCLQQTKHKVYGHSSNKEANLKIDFNNIKNLNIAEEFIIKNNINCIINNAGIYSDITFTDLTDIEINNIITVNLTAPIIITKYVYNNLIKNNKPGLIININSLAGKYPNYKEAVYCASKFGLSGFGSCLSINQKNTNIKIIDCYLGGTKSNITKDRDNYDTLIDPIDIASFITSLIENNTTGTVTSFEYRKTT